LPDIAGGAAANAEGKDKMRQGRLKRKPDSDMNVAAGQGTVSKIAGPFDKAAKKLLEIAKQHESMDAGSRAERSPPAQANNSDRVSDNDSNASSTGVTAKRPAKNNA